MLHKDMRIQLHLKFFLRVYFYYLKSSLQKFNLVANKKVLEKNLKDLSYDFSINDNFLNLFDRTISLTEIKRILKIHHFIPLKQSLEL